MKLYGNLLDVKKKKIKKAVIDIQGDRIVSVDYNRKKKEFGEQLIDTGSMTIMPGLIDGHVPMS